MSLQVSIRTQKDGDAIYALEDNIIVKKGDSVVYSDNHVRHAVAAAAPDANLTFSPMDSMRGATRGGVVLFSLDQENRQAVIHGMSKNDGDTLPANGMIFSVTQAPQGR